MPVKIVQPQGNPLTEPMLRTLRELLGVNASLTRQRIEQRAGGSAPVRELARRGLIAEHETDLDGVIERSWRITDLGRAAIGGAAMPAKVERNGAVAAVERPLVGAVAPWFGGCRRLADTWGGFFKGIKFVGVPFCGGLSEIPAMLDAGVNALALNDAHRHLINMARCMADASSGPRLFRRLRRQPFASQTLKDAQAFCAMREPDVGAFVEVDEEAAFNYFVCAWMSRSAEAGTSGEFKAGLAIRYGAGGGNSVLRFANAAWSIRAWRRILERASFSADDAFDFVKRINDRPDAGLYVDPPWPGPGDAYKHRFGDAEWSRLAGVLLAFKKARVVVRTGGGPLIERLFPRGGWKWLEAAGRDQGNSVKSEWAIVRNV